MANVVPIIPTGMTDGIPLKIVATATPGTIVHGIVATGSFDEVYLWATNTGTADVVLTVELGGTTVPDNQVKITVPAQDTILVIPGIRLTNSRTIRAFAATANVINMFGNVNRYS